MSKGNKAAKKPTGFEFNGGFSVGAMNSGEGAVEAKNNKKNKKQEEEDNDDEEEDDNEDEEDGDEEDEMDDLPPEVQRRVKALRSMHDDMDALQEEYRKERALLEKKYAAKKDEFYMERKKIVQGDKDVPREEGDEPDSEENIQGVPSFWGEVVTGHPDLGALFAEDDIPALNALTDVSCAYSEDFKSFTLSFHFKENEFFANAVLTKKYEVEPDLFDDAPGLTNCEGCDIEWKVGKNLCMAEIKKKQKAKSGRNKGQVRVVTRTVPKPSFFHFFKSPISGAQEEDAEEEDGEEEEHDEMGPRTKFAVEEDYDIAHVIRTSIIPEAILYFTQEKEFDDMYGMDEDDDEDEDGEEEEEEEGEEEEAAAGAKKGKKKSAPIGEKPQECKQN